MNSKKSCTWFYYKTTNFPLDFSSNKRLQYYFNTDCELVSDKFKLVSKSSRYNDNGTVLCKNGQMFYEDFFISNISARCNKNAEWDFDLTNLNCYKGLIKDYQN